MKNSSASSGHIGYLERFKKFDEDMYGCPVNNEYLLEESGLMREYDVRLGALGSFYVDEAS